MPRPNIWEPEDCLFPRDRLQMIKILLRKAPQGAEVWNTSEQPTQLTYSIALVRWDGEVRLAFRYDGDAGHPNGWPSSNSYPSWDILPRPMQQLLLPVIPLQYHQLVLDMFRSNTQQQSQAA